MCSLKKEHGMLYLGRRRGWKVRILQEVDSVGQTEYIMR